MISTQRPVVLAFHLSPLASSSCVMCDVWCRGLCESALAADGWTRFGSRGWATRSGWSREWRDEVRRSRTRTSKSWQHRSWVGFVSTPLHLPPFLRYLHQGSRLYLGWGMLKLLQVGRDCFQRCWDNYVRYCWIQSSQRVGVCRQSHVP